MANAVQSDGQEPGNQQTAGSLESIVIDLGSVEEENWELTQTQEWGKYY